MDLSKNKDQIELETWINLFILFADAVSVKQVGNFLVNYGRRVLNETKDDPEVIERLQRHSYSLTYGLYNRIINKQGIEFFLKNGYLKQQHLVHQ